MAVTTTPGTSNTISSERTPQQLASLCLDAMGESGYDVYIGRGSPWGNRYVIGVHGTRAECIDQYEEWIRTQPALLARLPELKGKVLGCHCSPLPCHGHVLVRLIEEMEAEKSHHAD